MSDQNWPATLSVEYRPVDILIPYVNNARTHSDAQIAQIAASIREFGFTNPILVDGENGIIAGHGRLSAARKLGMQEVPVIELAGLTDAQKRAYVLADNKLALNAGWDDALLRLELGELDAEGFDIGLIGFGEDELAGLLADKTDGLTDPDDVPEPPADPVTQLGDVWLLGKHRLVCGDSTDADTVAKCLNGEHAALVFTDPPYRMDVTGGSAQPIGRAASKLGEAIKHLCDFEPQAFLQVLPIMFAPRQMSAYVFCNKDLVPDYLRWAVDAGYSFNILIWKKPNAIPLGGQWRPDVEYLLVFRKGGIWNNAVSGASYSKVLEYGRENSTSHPTMKPVALIENQLLISSNTGSIVADPFGGSGSTIIACEKTGRRGYLVELDPAYCDVIVQRWQSFTGNDAHLDGSGETFNQLSASRQVVA